MCGCGDLKFAPKNHDHSYVTLSQVNAILEGYYTKQEVDTLLSDLQDLIEQVEVAPIGSIFAWPTHIIPANCLLCDGQEFSDGPEGYPLLFAVLGVNVVPNLQGEMIVGWKNGDNDFNTIGATGGQKEVTLTVAQMPAHSHPPQGSNTDFTQRVGAGSSTANPAGGSSSYVIAPNTGVSGGGDPHNNMPPYQVRHWVIKAK